VRVGDLADNRHFESRLRELLEYHNFLLEKRFGEAPVDFGKTLDTCLAQGERIWPIVGDVTHELHALRTRGASVLFEGAQGTMLDVDHGTFPFVTSSNTVAGYASVGTGLGPRDIDDVLGVVKAYTTRVGAGPFPTELDDEVGRHLSRVGQEFGAGHRAPATHGLVRRRRTRPLDRETTASRACASPSSTCWMGSTRSGFARPTTTAGRDTRRCRGGRKEPRDCAHLEQLPATARAYLARLESACAVPVTMISTGAERDDMIISGILSAEVASPASDP
jgi:adenylosuccinate synthase